MLSETTLIIFKTIVFLGVILGILFWFMLFFGFVPIVAIFEVDFYLLTSGVSLLACIILISYAIKGFWKTFLYCFMASTIILSLLLAYGIWADYIQYYQDFGSQCEIVSPDRQKTFVVKYNIPSAGLVDVWVYYKALPYLGSELAHYDPRNFCDSKWLDNNRMLTYDFSNRDGKGKVVKEVGLSEFNWTGLMWFSIFYGLLVLCVELLKRSPRILKWLSSPVSKLLQKP